MYKLNKQIKTGTLIFIIAMSLIMSNMNFQSIIGSYQTSSQAITANNNYNKSPIKDRSNTSVAREQGVALAVLGIAIVAAFVIGVGVVQTPPVIINKDYAKYNFSQFDN